MFTASSRCIGWSLADGKARRRRGGVGWGGSSQNSRGVEATGHEEDRRTSAPQVGVDQFYSRQDKSIFVLFF